jgi:uncharacterized delta-60 repeat protein
MTLARNTLISISRLACRSLPIALWALSATAQGQAGALDGSFGSNGIALGSPGALSAYASDICLQPDGRILVFGDYGPQSSLERDLLIARYLPDGSVDASFGNGGYFVTATGDTYRAIAKGAVLPDGRIMAACTSISNGDARFRLMRFQEDGTPDDLFGTNGMVDLNIRPSTTQFEQALALLVLDDGRVVIGGRTALGDSSDAVVVRLTEDGALDGSFGNGGVALFGLSDTHDQVSALSMHPNGWLVAGIQAEVQLGSTVRSDMGVLALGEDGAPAAAFGTDGVAMFPMNSSGLTYDLKVDGAGRILLAGNQTWPSTGIVIRCLDTGVLDPAFGAEGFASFQALPNSTIGRDLELQADGRILVASEAWNGAGTYNEFGLSRLLDNGTPDAQFGNGGSVHIHLQNEIAVARSMAIQSDGRILVAGYSFNPLVPSRQMITRHLVDAVTRAPNQSTSAGRLGIRPNPAGEKAIVEYDLTEQGRVTIELLDINGRRVRSPIDGGARSPGSNQELIDLRALEPGVYTLSLRTSSGRSSARLLKE